MKSIRSILHILLGVTLICSCNEATELAHITPNVSLIKYKDIVKTLNPQLHSRSATYIKRNGLLIRKITIKSSRPFQCAYHPLTP